MREWLHRSETQLRHLCLVIARTFAPDAIVLGGQLPDFVLQHLFDALSGPEPFGEDFEVERPPLIRARTDKHPQLGAASVPVYFNTSFGAVEGA